jgi:hypothetical protein
VEVQRLDSTQIASNIRTRGRVDLFTRTLRTFVRDLKRNEPAHYDGLNDELRSWFEDGLLEADESEAESEGGTQRLQRLAEWCVDVVMRFENVEDVSSWESWELVRRLLREHCRIEHSPKDDSGSSGGATDPDDRTVVVLPAGAIAGASLQSPFDPDATYGHKGVGYSVQIAETTGNDLTEILTDFEVRPAATNDWGQTTPAIDRLERAGHKPDVLLADAGYPTPSALLQADKRRVELIAPVSTNGLPADTIGRDRFELTEDGAVRRCPAGHEPLRHGLRVHANQKHPTRHAYFDSAICNACSRIDRCATRADSARQRKLEI